MNKKLEEILDEYRKDFSNVIGGMRGEILIKQAFAAGQEDNRPCHLCLKEAEQRGRQEVFDFFAKGFLNGALFADKLNDAVKEFRVRAEPKAKPTDKKEKFGVK